MQFTGRIHIRELEKKPIELEADQSEAWVRRLLERAAPDSELTSLQPAEWAAQSKFQSQLRVEKVASDYLVTGHMSGQVPAPCSRCGDDFLSGREADFRVVMHRLGPGSRASNEDSGDPDYVFFEGDEIDLGEILAEQLIVNEPVAECPARGANGDCVLCGKNPQFEASNMGNSTSDKIAGQGFENSAFSALSKLRTLKKST
jgi:uncharacterized metal-binding protein YceD (DUF177 family)